MIRKHLDWLRRKGATTATRRGREGLLRRLATVLQCDLIDATTEDLDRWQSSLALSMASIANYTMHVRGFYRWAEDCGLVEVDPARRLPRPKVPTGLPRPITEPHLALALTAAHEPLYTWLTLAAFMGLRSEEIAQIQREDVEEVDGRLWLRGIGKGPKPFRLPVPAGVEPVLRAHLGGQRGPLWRVGPDNRPAAARDCTGQTTALMRSLGLHYTLHALRHRFGTRYYLETQDPFLTAQVMRHDDLATTRLYVELSQSKATAAMDRLSTSLNLPAPRKYPKASSVLPIVTALVGVVLAACGVGGSPPAAMSPVPAPAALVLVADDDVPDDVLDEWGVDLDAAA
jgi:integrase/recombinase XerC